MELKNNINDSKQLISIIQSRYPKMSKGQKLIAQYIIKNYDKVAFMTASKLGDTVGVSESTVVRFANALGYSGYPKLTAQKINPGWAPTQFWLSPSQAREHQQMPWRCLSTASWAEQTETVCRCR